MPKVFHAKVKTTPPIVSTMDVPKCGLHPSSLSFRRELFSLRLPKPALSRSRLMISSWALRGRSCPNHDRFVSRRRFFAEAGYGRRRAMTFEGNRHLASSDRVFHAFFSSMSRFGKATPFARSAQDKRHRRWKVRKGHCRSQRPPEDSCGGHRTPLSKKASSLRC